MGTGGMESETLMVWLYSTLFVVGLVGNVFVIASILHILLSGRKSGAGGGSPNVVLVYVLGLSLTDLVVVCHLPFLSVWLQLKTWLFGSLACRLYIFAENANKILSTFILTALSWDRYVAVCCPAKTHVYRSYRAATGLVAGCFLLATLSLLPVLTISRVVDKAELFRLPPNASNGSLGFVCVFQPGPRVLLAFSSFLFLVGYLLPGLLMSFFYWGVLSGLRRTSMTERGEERAAKVANRILSLILFYFLCWTPHWLMQGIVMLELAPPSRPLVICNLLAFLLSYLNSSANPVLYALLNRQLRRSHSEALEKRFRSIGNVKKSAVLLLERHSERLLHLVHVSKASHSRQDRSPSPEARSPKARSPRGRGPKTLATESASLWAEALSPPSIQVAGRQRMNLSASHSTLL